MCVSNKPVQLSKRFFFSFLPALFCLWFHSGAWAQVQGCPIGGIPVMQAASKIGCVGGSLKFIIAYATYGVAPTPQFQFIINGNVVYTGAQDSYSVTQIAPTDVVSGYIIESGCTSAIATTQLTGLQFLPYTTPSVSIKSSQIGPSCPGSAITYTATPVNGGENPTYTWKINGVVAAVGNSVFTCDTLKDGDNVNCILTVNGNPCILANNVPSDTLTARFIPETAPSVVVTASANNVYQGTPLNS